MTTILVVAGIAAFIVFCVHFGRKESVDEIYEDTILDIEGRFEWARTRSFLPFGMEAQLEVSYELLGKAKDLWSQQKWHDAFRMARQSQEAMNRAQNIYSSAIKARQEDEKRQAAQAKK